MLTRRRLMNSMAGISLAGSFPAGAAALERFAQVDLRGSVGSGERAANLDGVTDRSAALNRLISEAAMERRPLVLPAGIYEVSEIELPDGANISGVPGATRLVYSGEGRFLTAENAGRIDLSGLVIDGGRHWLGDGVAATLVARGVKSLNLTDCDLVGSAANALALERCGGRVSGNRISGAADAAIYAVESAGLSITDNHVFDCGNGGILVHRWQPGADGTIVTGNRIERIRANDGGTGQHGNGINIFRAGNVMIANNHVSDCAFSAIRSNSGSNAQIVANQCIASGETAIYSEFSFEGAVIAQNLIDGGANGISVCNFNEGGRLATISGNVIRNIDAAGPYAPIDPGFGYAIMAEADTTVTGNTIDRAAKWGILLGWGPYLRNVSVTGNIVRDVPVGIAVSVVEGARQALIADNVIEGALGGAVVGFRWGQPTTADLASGGEPPPHLTIRGNLTS